MHRLILHHGGDDSDDEAVEGEHKMDGDQGRGHLAGLGLGSSLVAGGAVPRTKLVEVMDPRAGARSGGDQRPQRPPLTSQQEEALVNRKLESAAYQYNQLLTWQLGQQRLEYETRLCRMQHFIEEETFGLLRFNTSNTSSTSTSSSSSLGLGGGGDRARNRGRWREAVARLMAAERAKALRAVDQAKERLTEAERELGDLDMLGKGLAENKVAWEAKAQAAEAKLAETDKSYR